MAKTGFLASRDIGDLEGKVIFITGGNAGIGYEIARELAQHNPAHIYLTSRSLARGYDAIQRIKDCTPEDACAPMTVLPVDLASFDSIKAAVKTFGDVESKLDILINNAGVMFLPDGTTEEGYEIQFGINHMGHALLTRLLLPKMRGSSGSDDAGTAAPRVLYLTCASESLAPKDLKWNSDWIKSPTGGDQSTWVRYGTSKVAVMQYARALTDRYPEVTIATLNPGPTDTSLDVALRESLGWVLGGLFWYVTRYFFTKKPEQSATIPLWAISSPDIVSGEYYDGVGKPREGSELARSKESRDALWELTEDELKGHLSDDA